MRQRIGLAQALINDPEFIILDEPTSGLDPIGTIWMKDLIRELRDKGKTVLMCSHRLDDVQDVCDRIAILFNGDLQELGDVDKLVEDANRVEVRATNLRLTDELKRDLKAVIEQHGGKLESFGHPTTTLEDLFKKVVEESKARPGRRFLPPRVRAIEYPPRTPLAFRGIDIVLASIAPVVGVMKFEIEPLSFDDWRRLCWMGIDWLQDAGGFAMVGLVLWILNAYLNPIYDVLPNGRKRNRLIGPGMMLGLAIAVCVYLVALGLTYLVSGEHQATPRIVFLGVSMTAMTRALELALAGGGLAAILGFGGPFAADCLRLRWGRIYALAKLCYKEAVRRRVVWVFLSILILYLFPARWFFQEKPEDELKSIIGVTTRGMNVQLIAVGMLLAAFSIPTDIKNLTIHTIVTKPVERFEIVLGRFFGYLGLITIALVLMTVFGLLLINAGNLAPEAAEESMRARVARYGDMEFRSKKAADFTGVDVGREDVYRRYIAGHPQSSQRAVWSFKSVPDRFGKMEYVPVGVRVRHLSHD